MSEQLLTTSTEKSKSLENYDFGDNLQKYQQADANMRLEMFKDSLSELKLIPKANDSPSEEDFRYLENKYIEASPEDKTGMYSGIQEDIQAEKKIADSKKMASETESSPESSVPSVELNQHTAHSPMNSVTGRVVTV